MCECAVEVIVASAFFSPDDGSTAYDNCTTGAIRLPGGIGDDEGRVEICYNHVWASVCQLNFTMTIANMVCNTLDHQRFGGYRKCGNVMVQCHASTIRLLLQHQTLALWMFCSIHNTLTVSSYLS